MPPSPRRASASPGRRVLIAALAVAGTTLAATALAGPAQAATTPRYKLTLGPIAGSAYNHINLNGDIVGFAPQNGVAQGALFRAGSAAPLFLDPPASQAVDNPLQTPEGLNNATQVVGESDTGLFTALRWPDSSTPTDLSQLPGIVNTLFNTRATVINNNGMIAGWGQGVTANGDADIPFTIQNNVVTRLSELPNGGVDGQPVSANDAGVIVGQADTTTQDAQAVKWTNGAIRLLPELPGTLTSEALGVNNSGEAVGAAVLADLNAHAVLWANGKATDLHFGAALGGDAEASAINGGGVIVGDGGGHAFIFGNGTATDLNTLIPASSGVTLTTAAGINDKGDIVGTATVNATGLQFGYELTPTS